jgi:hypothetical protein
VFELWVVFLWFSGESLCNLDVVLYWGSFPPAFLLNIKIRSSSVCSRKKSSKNICTVSSEL